MLSANGQAVAPGAGLVANATIPCDLCQNIEVEELSLKDRDGAYLRTVICKRCGLAWSDPRPTTEEVHDYYRHSYRLDYKATYQPKLKHVYRAGLVAWDRYHRLRSFLPAGASILDIGAGGGELVYILRAAGHNATGLEPNEGYATFASNVLNLPVRLGFYEDAAVAEASQDLITLYHVVEHLESPAHIVRHVRHWIKPKGLLLIEVPNIEARCQGPRSRFHRAHLYNFNSTTLEMLGRQAQFDVVHSSVSSDGGNITVIFQKSPHAAVSGIDLQSNYRRVRQIVDSHTTFSHFLTFHPYVRPARKLFRRISEWRRTRSARSPSDILERIARRVHR